MRTHPSKSCSHCGANPVFVRRWRCRALVSGTALLVMGAWPALVEGQVRLIEVPNLRPRPSTPGRFDTVMVRANASPDTAAEVSIVTDVVLDSAGHILAVDARGRRLIVMDTAGRVQGTLGRAGAGPGEFRFPYLATVTAGGTVVVLDETLSRLSLFDSRLQFIRTVPLPGYVRASSLLALGDRIFISGTLNVAGAQDKAIHALSIDGTYLGSFGTLVDAANPSVRASIGGGVLAPARNGGLWYSQRAPYLIERYAPDGTLQLRINRANEFLPSAESAFRIQVSDSRTVLMAPTPFARAVAIEELPSGVLIDQTALPSGEVVTDLFRPTRDGSYELVSSHLHPGPILLRRGPGGTYLSLFREDWHRSSGVMVVRFRQ